MENNIRCKQRFDNFSKAYILLAEIKDYNDSTLDIIKQGFIQRFEIAFELALKTTKDYLTYSGHTVQPSPRQVIKEAFTIEVITNGHAFINMLDAKNLIAHTCDKVFFNEIFLQIKNEFEPALGDLVNFYKEVLS